MHLLRLNFVQTNLQFKDGSRNSSLKIYNDTRSPSEEFYRRKVLDESKGIEDFGVPKWDLTLIILLVWVIVYFCLWKGVKSTGNTVQ